MSRVSGSLNGGNLLWFGLLGWGEQFGPMAPCGDQIIEEVHQILGNYQEDLQGTVLMSYFMIHTTFFLTGQLLMYLDNF